VHKAFILYYRVVGNPTDTMQFSMNDHVFLTCSGWRPPYVSPDTIYDVKDYCPDAESMLLRQTLSLTLKFKLVSN